MAGFRDFQTGEILTATNVNDFLMQQSVMKFADAAARDTALGTAVGGGNALREGMASYLDDADALQIYDGSAWATVGNAGIGSNVVTATKTDTFTLSSTTYATVTGLSVTLTPTSDTSKVLIHFSVPYHFRRTTGHFMTLAVFADGSNLIVPDTPGSRMPTIMNTNFEGLTEFSQIMDVASFTIVHSPNTTSAVTYDVRARVGGGNGFVNRASDDTDNANRARGVATITAIEVAA